MAGERVVPLTGVLTAPPEVAQKGVLAGPKRVVDWCCYVLLGLALAEELVGTLAVVIARVFGHSVEWQVTVGQLSLGILTFFGGAIAYSEDRTIKVQAFAGRLPAVWRGHIKVAMDTAVCLSCGFAAMASVSLLQKQWDTISVSVPISQALYVLPYTIGMSLLALYACREVVLSCINDYRRSLSAAIVVLLACAVAAVWFAGYSVPLGGMLAVLIVVTVVVLLLGMPISIAFVVGPLVTIVGTRVSSPVIIPVQLNDVVSKTLFVALPFFIWVGLILASSDITLRLTRVMQLLVGRVRGGFYQIILLLMLVFSGMSGSKFADMTAIGTPLEPMLDEMRGERREAGAVISASAVMGETIPPSIALIVLGSVTTVSIAGLFVGGLIPAVVLWGVMVAVVYVRARRKGAPPIRVPWDRQAFKAIGSSIPALLIPVVIAGGIVGRLASPTEVSSFAVAYALVLAVVGYRVRLRSLWASTKAALATSGWILFLVSGATALSWVLTYDGVPQKVASLALDIGTAHLFMLVSIAVLILFGLFLEGSPAIVVLAPIMVPAATALGIPPVQFGIVLVIAMGIGAHLPPVGVGLFVAGGVMKVEVHEIFRPMMVFAGFLTAALVVIALVPQITMWVPNMLNVGS